MEHARPPAELCLEGGPSNRAEAWRKWLRQFQVFLKASGVHKESKDVQASLLINLIGPDGYDIFNTLKFAEESDKENIDIVIEKFNIHFGTKVNTTMVRFKFFTRSQEAGESIDEYVTALKLLSQRCEFQQLEDSLLRDRIVCGVIDTAVRDRLLRTDDLTLEKAVKICQANEISNDSERQIEGVKMETKSVDSLWRSRNSYRGARGATRGNIAGAGGPSATRCGRGAAGAASAGAASGSGRTVPDLPPAPAPPRVCGACAGVYCDGGERCAARKVKCFYCGSRGHFRVLCPVRKSKKVYELSEDCQNEMEEEDLYYVSSLECDVLVQMEDSKWYETLSLPTNSVEHRFKLDTGSDLNVLSKNNYIKLGLSMSDVIQDNTRAKSFCGNLLSIIGSCTIRWRHKHENYDLKFVISDQNCQSILGKDALEQLGLIKRVYSINLNNFKDLFSGLGKLPGKYTIPIEENATPCICPVRKVPVGIRDQLKKELARMEDLGVIRKVSHPTQWVNGMVPAPKKDGELRICLDPRMLNRHIKRQHYPLPTLTEIATKLEGARYFSKLDAKSGFWMIELDDKSADLCTFGTPFDRYQYLRLPYGINSASEVFHARVRQLLEDLHGVDSFVDDIIVWGSTKEEHDDRLKNLLKRAKEVGIKFNPEKCEFCVREVTYLGHTFGADGMKIDKSKLKAITHMPSPSDRQSLERFLGMVNYVSKFIPNYSERVAPLRNLLKKQSEWCWGPCEEKVVSDLKKALCSAPVLALFDARRPAVLSVDASARALGAALLQDGRPVEFASSTLTDTQQRYAQIEKEMLAIVFALERFHQYVYGKCDITVETDHKPLEALFQKSLDSVPARLQRMMLRVQRYDFKVMYKPGKYMYVADTLSRAPLPDLMHSKISEELVEQSCFVIQNVRFSDDRLKAIKTETQKDEECQQLIKYIQNGWPLNKFDMKECARLHWSHRETFEYIDGVLFVNNLVYIPKSLRPDMIAKVHEGHLGIDRCKRRARDVMFWPGMSRDVERAVRRCRVCAEHATRPLREPMLPHTLPSLPWSKSSGSGSSSGSCSDEACSVCSKGNGPPPSKPTRSAPGPAVPRALQPTRELLKAREASKRSREEKVLEWQRSQMGVSRPPSPTHIKREGERRRPPPPSVPAAPGAPPLAPGRVSPAAIQAALAHSSDSDSEPSDQPPPRLTLSERFGKMAQWSADRSARLENMLITRRDSALHVAYIDREPRPRRPAADGGSGSESPGSVRAATAGAYPEELLLVAPAGLSWDDVRVRYDYYKQRGYLRGLSLADYVKWEEWWYKYQEWLKRERAMERWADEAPVRRERRRRGGRGRRS